MTDIRLALQQVRRLRVTNYFAMLDEEGVGELARMLSFSNSEIIAVAVINQWLEEQTERPTPADLRRLVADHNEAQEMARLPLKPDVKCWRCHDVGYLGGNISGPGARPWEWCTCAVAVSLRLSRPDMIDQANDVREKLLPSARRSLQKIPRAHVPVEKVYGDV